MTRRQIRKRLKPKLKISACSHSPAIMIYWPSGWVEYRNANTYTDMFSIIWFLLVTVFQNKYDLTIER